MKIRILKMSIVTLIVILMAQLVSAFGVTTPHWDDNPLAMSPGETRDIALILQNMVGERTVGLRASLDGGSEIATLIDKNLDYVVPFGKDNIKVNLRVSIPQNTQLGSRYDIIVSFKQFPVEDEGGMIQIAGGVGTKIPVIVGPKTEAKQTATPTAEAVRESEGLSTSAIFVFLALIIVIMLWVVLKRRSN